MNLRHAMILAINTSILAVLFAFTSWLYVSSKAEVEAQVAQSIERAAGMTNSLSALHEGGLSNLAQSLAQSPLVKGALATQDKETIQDVLRTIASKNRLTLAVLSPGGSLSNVRYASRAFKFNDDMFFRGFAPAGALTLVLCQAPDRVTLDSWSNITGVRYAIGPFDNVPPEDAAILKAPAIAGRSVVSAKNSYYRQYSRVAGGTSQAALFVPYSPFWKPFETRRNSLVILGGILFFFGLLLSLVFSSLIEGQLGASQSAAVPPDWDRLLDEIEKARDKKG